MQQVAGAVLLSKSGTTRVVGQLEECGLVHRETPSDNRRITYAVLSDEGRRRITAAMPVLFGLVDEHFGRHLGRADTTTLLRILAKLPCPGSENTVTP